MFKFRVRPKFAAVLLAFLFSFAPLNIVFGEVFQWAITGNILYFPSDDGVQADPAPILPSLGGAVSLQIWGPLRVELTEDIYIANYEYIPALGYPTACNPENRSSLVIGFVTAILFSGNFPIGSDDIICRVYFGPAVDIRVVTLATGLNSHFDFGGDIETDAQLQTDATSEYFWSNNRWFMPVAGVGMDFRINDKFLLGFDLRAWFPIYKLWTDTDLPAINGWRFGVGFRITPLSKNVNQEVQQN
ncbi:MAG: hypothetical protein LBI28_09615 [Treponema sp.]|jgi:hypothetical protein|nr:hypothetical protein [Treponema sp.]